MACCIYIEGVVNTSFEITIVFRFGTVPDVEAVQLISRSHTSLVKVFKSIFSAKISLCIDPQGAVFRKTIVYTSSDQMGNVHFFVVTVLIQNGRDIGKGSRSEERRVGKECRA